MYTFVYDCVLVHSYSRRMKELETIIDNMKEITVRTFLKHVPFQHVLDTVRYASYETKRELMDDCCARYYRVKRKCLGLDVYVIVHSAVESIYKKAI